MDHTTIGAGARLRRVIADRFNLIPDGARIGLEPAEPRQGSADPGITVLPRGPTRAPA